MNSINENSASINVKNTFENVVKIYEETSFLLQDFSAILKNDYKFESCNNNKIDNYGGYSRSLDWPQYWFSRCVEMCFKPNGQTNNNRLINITVIFYNKHKEEAPRLVIGVLDTDGQSGWLHDAYHNESNNYKYSHEYEYNNMRKFDFQNDKILGSLFTRPLLLIKNYEHVKELATCAIKLWQEFGKKNPQANLGMTINQSTSISL